MVASLRLLCPWFLLAASLAAAAIASVGSRAPDFSIEDQYGHPVQLAPLHGKRVLIVCGDRTGSNYMGAWIHGLGKTSDLTLIRIANLKGVPSFMHGFVKHKFDGKNAKGQPSAPVALDWDGVIPREYGFENDLANVYLIDSSGVLRYATAGKGTPDEVERLQQAVKGLE